MITLTLRTLCWDQLRVDVEASETVFAVKQKIVLEEIPFLKGVKAKNMRLLIQGQFVKDCETLGNWATDGKITGHLNVEPNTLSESCLFAGTNLDFKELNGIMKQERSYKEALSTLVSGSWEHEQCQSKIDAFNRSYELEQSHLSQIRDTLSYKM